jgi:hypothetical protein
MRSAVGKGLEASCPIILSSYMDTEAVNQTKKHSSNYLTDLLIKKSIYISLFPS